MPQPPKHKSLLPITALLVLGFGLAYLVAYTALHRNLGTVPEEARNRPNPVAPTEAGIASARTNYLDKCSECHGTSGKGDGPQAKLYDPLPADHTNAQKMKNFTDGELFYIISEGRKPMPSFKKRYSEEQIWQLVNLVRSFSKAPQN